MTSPQSGIPENAPIRLGHSPDSDDAFMFYGLAEGKVDTEGLSFEHILRDIETLNQWAREGQSGDHGHLGACLCLRRRQVCDPDARREHGRQLWPDGRHSRASRSSSGCAGERIAIPGTMTSAFLALRLFLGDFEYDIMPFDEIMEAVKDGQGRGRAAHPRGAIDACGIWAALGRGPGEVVARARRRAAAATGRQRRAPRPWPRAHGAALAHPQGEHPLRAGAS